MKMQHFKRFKKYRLKKLLIFALIFLLGIGVGYSLINKVEERNSTKAFTAQGGTLFISEVYDKVKENYWDNLSDTQLIEIFKLSAGKVKGTQIPAKLDNKEKLLSEIEDLVKYDSPEDRNKFIVDIISTTLSSLNPTGRSGLYTEKLEQDLKNTVENVNPGKDLYNDLGLAKGASDAAVEQAFSKQSEELKKQDTPEAKEKLKNLAYAKEVLTKEDTKQRYDTKGVEPTIFSKLIGSNILYVQFKKFSPTSYDEFVKAFESQKNSTKLSGLILDLRQNVGGAIDATPYFLGLFLGKNQYAYEFYKKGEYLPFKTPTDKLASIDRFKQVVILVDNQTQSSAEMMASSLKKYRVGVVMGEPTRGWGTVERIFPLDSQISEKEKYSLFLVHSITLRDDNLPIEGRGVEPNINIKNSNWQQQFNLYFNSPSLLNAVKEVLGL